MQGFTDKRFEEVRKGWISLIEDNDQFASLNQFLKERPGSFMLYQEIDSLVARNYTAALREYNENQRAAGAEIETRGGISAWVNPADTDFLMKDAQYTAVERAQQEFVD